jgi:2-dehydro-3-deoxyphosphogluconate aldolase/(4S)-4-hydroxy-2-oxoglutarate aldolase
MHTRLDIYQALVQERLVILFHNPDFEASRAIIDACLAGGCRIIEFTNRGQFAYHTFTALRQHYAEHRPDLILGAGTVVDAPTAALFIASGADFIVSPSFDEATARLCNRRKVAYIPGCATPTEMLIAQEWGMEFIKVFPANLLGGASFIKAVKAPHPELRVMASGGVSPEDAADWLQAGTDCISIGSAIKGNPHQIEQQVADLVRICQRS